MATKTVCDNCGKIINPEHQVRIEIVKTKRTWNDPFEDTFDLCDWRCVEQFAVGKGDL